MIKEGKYRTIEAWDWERICILQERSKALAFWPRRSESHAVAFLIVLVGLNTPASQGSSSFATSTSNLPGSRCSVMIVHRSNWQFTLIQGTSVGVANRFVNVPSIQVCEAWQGSVLSGAQFVSNSMLLCPQYQCETK
jgi:hypothetical protein